MVRDRILPCADRPRHTASGNHDARPDRGTGRQDARERAQGCRRLPMGANPLKAIHRPPYQAGLSLHLPIRNPRPHYPSAHGRPHKRHHRLPVAPVGAGRRRGPAARRRLPAPALTAELARGRDQVRGRRRAAALGRGRRRHGRRGDGRGGDACCGA